MPRETTAVVTNRPNDDTILRIKFADGTAVNIIGSKVKFRVTTSSPAIIGNPDLVVCLKVLNKIGTPVSYLCGESFLEHMERFRALAAASETIIEFATKVNESMEPAHEPDETVGIWSDTADNARRMFDAPPHWPCKAVRTENGRTLFELQAEGL